jgi:aminoglycoside/choline kinase family phosphotransferase
MLASEEPTCSTVPVPATAEIVERLLPGRQVEGVLALSSSERTTVERVQLASVAGGVESVVAKRFVHCGGYAAEAAALSCLPAGIPAPVLIAEDRRERLVVMTDFGAGPSLADALLGVDRQAAESALGEWAEALAALHRATTNLRTKFTTGVLERAEDASLAVDPMPRWLVVAADSLRALGTEMGVAVPDGIEEELDAVIGSLSVGGEALSPGDTCPDNNMRTAEGLVLVDFEEAAFRHVAWDAAYLRVPWPSCWCAWAIPETVATDVLGRYFRAGGEQTFWADAAALERDVDLATLGWGLISGAWYLPSGLKRDDTMGLPGVAAPPRRATVIERFRVSAAVAERLGYQRLAEVGRSLQQVLERRWGPLTLPTAPALR